ncbi:MAG: rod shape-determining protein MreC [Bacteroidaceae bacterium]|nr:rod shape-determining protein MreC [Bacteroidaceae bacterium]
MRNLLDFLLNYKHWFVFILLEFIGLAILFNHNGYQKSVYFTTANGVVGNTYSFISSVTSYLNLGTENQALEAKNEQLRQKVAELEKQLEVASKDSTKHISGLSTKYNVVSAQIVGGTIHKSNNLFTINKGTADGIKEEMGVVCSNGVVGIVYLTSRHYSIVIPLINANSKVSCKLRGTQHFGTLQWQRGRADIAYMTDVPRHAKIKKGEVVLTNGYSDIFPPGIPIGFIIDKKNSSDGFSYLLKIGLYTKFETLREVSVITNYTKPERKLLESQADSLINQLQ